MSTQKDLWLFETQYRQPQQQQQPPTNKAQGQEGSSMANGEMIIV